MPLSGLYKGFLAFISILVLETKCFFRRNRRTAKEIFLADLARSTSLIFVILLRELFTLDVAKLVYRKDCRSFFNLCARLLK